jgi:hypothetical protein
MTTTQPKANMLVPHYGPGNNERIYNNYGLPQQPTYTPTQQQGSYQESMTAPPPTSPDSPRLVLDFPPELSHQAPFSQQQQRQQPVDLLDDYDFRSSIDVTAEYRAPQEQAWPQTIAPTTVPQAHNMVPRNDDVSDDIIASQERALAEIRQRHEQSLATKSTTTQSRPLTVPIYVPRSNNPSGSDAVHPQKKTMKHVRKFNTAAGVAGGALVGGLAFGPAFPLGMVLGGSAGGYAANKVSKSGERLAQRKWEQQSFQRGVDESPAVRREGAFA